MDLVDCLWVEYKAEVEARFPGGDVIFELACDVRFDSPGGEVILLMETLLPREYRLEKASSTYSGGVVGSLTGPFRLMRLKLPVNLSASGLVFAL